MTEQSTSQNPDAHEVCLCEADCELLDALVECGFDVDRFEGAARIRAERLVHLLGLIDQYPVEPTEGPALVADTMLCIDQYERGKRQPVIATIGAAEGASPSFLGGFNWRSTLTAAAAILILVSVTVPMLANMRRTAMQQACLSGIGNIALGLTNYANTYDNSLPIHTASAPNGNWLQSRANSANLFHLAKAGFATFEDLACPGNPYAEPSQTLATLENWPSAKATSFSFQNLMTRQRPRWNTPPTMVILADKSPVVEAAHRGQPINIDTLSSSHRRGQNALLSDASGMWLDSAQFGNDNIWVPDSCQAKHTCLNGTEVPGCETDSMLIH